MTYNTVYKQGTGQIGGPTLMLKSTFENADSKEIILEMKNIIQLRTRADGLPADF